MYTVCSKSSVDSFSKTLGLKNVPVFTKLFKIYLSHFTTINISACARVSFGMYKFIDARLPYLFGCFGDGFLFKKCGMCDIFLVVNIKVSMSFRSEHRFYTF